MTESPEQLALRIALEVFWNEEVAGNEPLFIEFARRLLEAERGQTEIRCPHEFYNGMCVHCELTAAEYQQQRKEFAGRQERVLSRPPLGESPGPASPANLGPVAEADAGILNWIDGKQFNEHRLLYAIPPGWTLAPMEPTERMGDAGVLAGAKSTFAADMIFRAMLNAVSKP